MHLLSIEKLRIEGARTEKQLVAPNVSVTLGQSTKWRKQEAKEIPLNSEPSTGAMKQKMRDR